MSTSIPNRLIRLSYRSRKVAVFRHRRPYHRANPSIAAAHPAPRTRQAAVDPYSLLAAAAFALSIGYVTVTHETQPSPPEVTKEILPSEVPIETLHIETTKEEDDMAPHMLPGRPGNLTPDQEQKLKEMWMATLEVFGVAHDEAHPNGLLHPPPPASTTTANDSASEAKKDKKRKSRLSLFGKSSKKDTADSETSSLAGDDNSSNDKHGQTKEFQQALASQTPAQLREAFWSMTKHDHPDALLLRFLRARKWDVNAALIMLVATMHWRSQEMHVDDDIMLRGEAHAFAQSRSTNPAEKKEGEDFLAQLRMGKSFLHGTDKDGRPCCYVRVRLHHGGEQSNESLERFTVYTIETARMLLRAPVDTATIVFDMTDFSMANMDYTPVKFMIKCFEANYPESLGSVLVYKSPWIFQGIWKIIKGWLDPVVASKVHFASNINDLTEWIPRGQIMKELGGDEAYTYSYPEPTADENARMADTATRDRVVAERKELVQSYETETLSWLHNEDKGEGRTRLAQRLAENYWQADPFLRATSLYDRLGVIRPGGLLEFYPKAQAVGSARVDEGVD